MDGRRLARIPSAILAAALCAAPAASGCGSPGSTGFEPGGSGASSGGDDASGTGGNDGGAGDGGATANPAGASGSSSGAGGSSSGAPSPVVDASHDGPAGDARGTEAGSGSGAPDGGSLLDSARQACVDRINMYRATIGVAPLALAPASVEACSDQGAMKDATTNSPHSSAGTCPGTGAQDTCPDLPVGGPSGATLLSSLAQCLDEMWAEGPPPAGTTVAQCIQDYTGCFLKHGHYINMSDSYEQQTSVSCGFYLMSTGAYWGNQDFLP